MWSTTTLTNLITETIELQLIRVLKIVFTSVNFCSSLTSLDFRGYQYVCSREILNNHVLTVWQVKWTIVQSAILAKTWLLFYSMIMHTSPGTSTLRNYTYKNTATYLLMVYITLYLTKTCVYFDYLKIYLTVQHKENGLQQRVCLKCLAWKSCRCC